MTKIVGVVFILLGLFLGFYVGGYLMFIGGIIQVIEAIRATTLIPADIAWGIGKVAFASFVGWVSAVLPLSIGVGLINDN